MSLPPPAAADPRVLDRVRHLHLRARQLVAGVYHGPKRSIHTGQDVEFADYKPYTPGDALRDLDWRVLARSDRLAVKRYRAETELVATLVLDASADLGSTSAKFEAAILLTATLATWLVGDGEPVGLIVGAGEGLAIRRLPPQNGRSHLAMLLTMLASVRPAGRAGLDGLFREVGERLPLRSLVAVVGDFAEDPAGWIPSLDALSRRRVDLRAFQVYDPAEVDLHFSAPLRVFSPEAAGREDPIDPVALRAPFRATFDQFSAEIRDAFHARRGLYTGVSATEDLTPVVSRFIRGVP